MRYVEEPKYLVLHLDYPRLPKFQPKSEKPGNSTGKGCDYFCQVKLIKFFPRGKTDIERTLTL